MSNAPKVFISYSHDDERHEDRVLELADRLRRDGIDAELDQYIDSPPEGWPLWCEQRIEDADFVVLVCTEIYHRRVSNKEKPGVGHGVLWEARIIRQILYDIGRVSGKFIPVFFSDGSADYIPTPVKSATWYVVDVGPSYERLCRQLTGQPLVVKPPLGEAKALPPKQPKPGAAAAARLEEQAEASVPPPPPEIPPAYIDWLKRTHTNVNLLGQEADKSHAFQLDHVYVPALTLAPTTLRVGSSMGVGRHLVPLLQRLDRESLCILAQAGAGKSTFCRWAVLRSVAAEEFGHPVPAPDQFAEPSPKHLRGKLPVLIPFREFAPRTDWGCGGQTWCRSDLEQALAAWSGRAIDDLPGDCLLAHLKAGTAFLLLDGLDEIAEMETRNGVTLYPRELVLSALVDALPQWLKAGNRILLTSRPAGIERAGLSRLGLDQTLLEPLPRELQELFIRRWFHTLRKEELAAGLIGTIRERGDEFAPLFENPMLLTAICILYDSGGRLPEDRYKLYKRIVDNVLFNRFPGGSRQTEPVKARLEAIALRMHEGDKSETRHSPAAEVSELEAEKVLRDIAAEGWCEEDRRVEPAIRLNDLLEKSGLLLPRPDQRAAFYHLTVQEYLAAERILRSGSDLDATFLERSAVPEWRSTLLFLFGGKMDTMRPDWGSRLLGRLIESQPRTAVKANPSPAVFIADALELILARGRPVPDPVKNAFTNLILNAIQDEIEVRPRQSLGLCLGRLGDPRIRSLRDPEAYVEVPPVAYVEGKAIAYYAISARTFRSGKIVEFGAPYRLGRYPVTNSQYREFVDDGGYHDERWWSEEGWNWLQVAGATEPEDKRLDRRWNGPNQPVVDVCFWEAEACSAWAGGRLPSDQEWIAAARGPRGLNYPWGEYWSDGICNTIEAGLGITSPVGLFPHGRQVDYGLEDLVGNVWERCGPRERSTLRGGACCSGVRDVRSVNRDGYWLGDRLSFFGFRVCVPASGADD